MINWGNRARALEEAADVAAVCRPRPLPGVEVFDGNEFYGSDAVIKAYAGWPARRPLKLVVPHGLVFDPSYVWRAEARSRLPAVLAYGEARALAYARATRKMVIRSAVPFAYAARLAGPPEAFRVGTLAFPSHSTHHLTAQADFGAMADRLLALDARFQPVRVCIYWRDYELGRHKPFESRGLQVVSAGHMFDPAFLYRLAHLLATHRYVTSNHVGSSLIYGEIAGCAGFLLTGFDVSYTGSQADLRRDQSKRVALTEELEAAFSCAGEPADGRRLELVRQVGGLEHLLEPGAMHACLAAAERLDRFGVAAHPQSNGWSVALPMALVRAPWTGLRALRSAWSLVS